ncbi:MAG: VOC family protein [Alphaproteobacteria bacterium]
MAIEGIFYVEILVSDLARSKRFYGETLGWKLGTDEPGVAGFHFGAGYLVVLADNRPAHERRYAGGMFVEVKVDDLDAQHAGLAKAGVKVSTIEAKPWGERNFSFADPDGYVWHYGQG